MGWDSPPESRNWMMVSVLVLMALVGCGGGAARAQDEPLPDCEWCGAAEAPADLSWHTTLADEGEPGQRLLLTGTVYSSDGEKPAPGILLYLYHTNNEGLYRAGPETTGNGRRHGDLRGWVRTSEEGRFRVMTIKPMPYPGRSEPAHIHITVKEPGRDEYWIDSVHFDDDPLLTEELRARFRGLGGSGVVTLRLGSDGSLTAVRDIVLKP